MCRGMIREEQLIVGEISWLRFIQSLTNNTMVFLDYTYYSITTTPYDILKVYNACGCPEVTKAAQRRQILGKRCVVHRETIDDELVVVRKRRIEAEQAIMG